LQPRIGCGADEFRMQYGVEEGAKAGFAQIDALLARLRARAG
jgi:hypothetical protein